jgi:hypothetical protein
MAAARPVAHVFSGELRAGSGVEDVRVTVELTLEDLPIDQTNGPCAGDRPETASRSLSRYRRSGLWGRHGPTAIQDDALTPKYCSMNHSRAEALVIRPLSYATAVAEGSVPSDLKASSQ